MTSAEIARIANVSRSTVSRVINQYDNVPEATRKKIQAIIDEYGYTPNNSARILAGKSNNIIGIFLADICENKEDSRWVGVNSPYNMEMISHFVENAKKEGFLTLIYTISDLKECKEMETYFSNRMIYGGVFIGFPYRTQELEDMAKKGYNVVLVDQLSDLDDKLGKIKRVNTDNVLGGLLATNYLIEQGHSKIVHVSGDDRLSSYEREKGYKQSMKQANIKETVVLRGLYRENIAYEETQKYLKSKSKSQLPTAFFVANDIMALGVIRAIEEQGLKIPEDISIVGFDHLQWAVWMDLSLSSVDASKKNLAKYAIDLLLDKETPTFCTPKVVKKDSVARIETSKNSSSA